MNLENIPKNKEITLTVDELITFLNKEIIDHIEDVSVFKIDTWCHKIIYFTNNEKIDLAIKDAFELKEHQISKLVDENIELRTKLEKLEKQSKPWYKLIFK